MKQSVVVGFVLSWPWIALVVAPLVTAQDTSAEPPRQRRANPAYAPPDVNPELPNVLLLGDSISIGYMLPTRQELQGQANTWRPATNCGPTTLGLESLEQWLGDKSWDVIHFNFGLHDLKYMSPTGRNLVDPESPGAHQQVPIEQYAANLRQIAERLKATGAQVIWCETTPVPPGSQGRVAGDARKYNAAAAQVIAEVGGIATNPLHAFALQHAEQRPANVHYTPAGSAKLAEQVARTIRKALNLDPERPAPNG